MILRTILDMKVDDAVVMLLEVFDGVVARGGEMPISRLIMKYFDIWSAASKLSGLANWLGSFMLSWPCMATSIL